MNRFRFLLPGLSISAAVLAALLVMACGAELTAAPHPTATFVPAPSATPTPAATSTPTPAPEKHLPSETLIPEGAGFVVDVMPSAVLDSQVVMLLIGALSDEGEMEDDPFEALERETGVSMRSIDSVEMFFDLESVLGTGAPRELTMENAPALKMGAALRGEIDEERFHASFQTASFQTPSENQSELIYEVESYRGYDLYVDASAGPNSISFGFLDSDTLLLGTSDGVKTMIDVAEGVHPPLSDDTRGKLDALGRRHMGVILETPPESLDMASEVDPMSMGLLGMLDPTALSSPLTVLRIFTSNSDIEISVRQFFEEEATAAAAKEYAEGSTAVIGLMSGSTGLQEIISGMTISQSGDEVSYNLTISEAQALEIVSLLFALSDTTGESGSAESRS